MSAKQTTHDGFNAQTPTEVLAHYLTARKCGDEELIDAVTADDTTADTDVPADGFDIEVVELFDSLNAELARFLDDDTVVVNEGAVEDTTATDARLVGAKIKNGGFETHVAAYATDEQIV